MSANDPLPWWGTVALIAAYLGFTIVYLGSADGQFDATGHLLGRDFMVFWSAAVLTAQGHLLDLFDAIAFREFQAELFARELPIHQWSHPPQMLFIVLPFAPLPYLWALAAWSLLTVGADYAAG